MPNPKARSYAGMAVLVLDGVAVGAVQRVEGGEPFATVITTTGTPGSPIEKKHVGLVDIQPIQISFGLDVDARLFDWIAEWLEGRQTAKDGSLVFSDNNLKIAARLDFSRAIITGLSWPTLDAGAKDSLAITLTIQPEATARRAGGEVVTLTPSKRKNVGVNCFRFALGALDASRIESVQMPAVTTRTQLDPIGQGRQPMRTVGPMVVSNLTLTLPSAHAEPYFDLADRFLMQGHATDADELTARVDLLALDGRKVLLTVVLGNVGVVRVAPTVWLRGADAVQRVRAEFYCERVSLTPLPD